MANWTTPKTWTSEILTSANLNTYNRDNMTFVHDMAENAALGFVFDGGGGAIVAGIHYEAFAPGPATILGAQSRSSDITSDVSATFNVFLLHDSDGAADFSSDTWELVSGGLTLSTDTGIYKKWTADSDWSTAILENDQLQFKLVDNTGGVTLASFELLLHKG